ncbi:hypothetical protein V8G54_023397 [Vigna mungo]|uniref:Uncharacterized protein n=1 Tax=Vigna mungo TaxID=3915 RepID=A0AAQ3N4T9_VIGMU
MEVTMNLVRMLNLKLLKMKLVSIAVEEDGGDDDVVMEGEGDGEDDVVGQGDGGDEFDVSSWIGSQDDFVSEDDVVYVSVHRDEQPQDYHYEGSVFVEVGTPSWSSTPWKHVQARGLSDSE